MEENKKDYFDELRVDVDIEYLRNTYIDLKAGLNFKDLINKHSYISSIDCFSRQNNNYIIEFFNDKLGNYKENLFPKSGFKEYFYNQDNKDIKSLIEKTSQELLFFVQNKIDSFFYQYYLNYFKPNLFHSITKPINNKDLVDLMCTQILSNTNTSCKSFFLNEATAFNNILEVLFSKLILEVKQTNYQEFIHLQIKERDRIDLFNDKEYLKNYRNQITELIQVSQILTNNTKNYNEFTGYTSSTQTNNISISVTNIDNSSAITNIDSSASVTNIDNSVTNIHNSKSETKNEEVNNNLKKPLKEIPKELMNDLSEFMISEFNHSDKNNINDFLLLKNLNSISFSGPATHLSLIFTFLIIKGYYSKPQIENVFISKQLKHVDDTKENIIFNLKKHRNYFNGWLEKDKKSGKQIFKENYSKPKIFSSVYSIFNKKY